MVEARSVAPQRLPWLRNRCRCSSLVQLLLNSGILKAFSFLWRLLFYAKVVVATHSRCVTWLSNVWLWTDYCVATFSCLLCKRHLRISQNALYLPPKFCITFFSFLLSITAVLSITMLMQNFGWQIRCIMGDICKWRITCDLTVPWV